jgi:hypothetical protein
MKDIEKCGIARIGPIASVQKANWLPLSIKLTLWILAALVCGYYLIISFTSSQEVWVQNKTGKAVLIKNCNLNNEPIDNCFFELKEQRSVFFKPQKILFHPKTNNLSIRVLIDNNEYQYNCNFYRKKTDCIEEVSIGNGSLFCAEYCTSVFD